MNWFKARILADRIEHGMVYAACHRNPDEIVRIFVNPRAAKRWEKQSRNNLLVSNRLSGRQLGEVVELIQWLENKRLW